MCSRPSPLAIRPNPPSKLLKSSLPTLGPILVIPGLLRQDVPDLRADRSRTNPPDGPNILITSANRKYKHSEPNRFRSGSLSGNIFDPGSSPPCAADDKDATFQKTDPKIVIFRDSWSKHLTETQSR